MIRIWLTEKPTCKMQWTQSKTVQVQFPMTCFGSILNVNANFEMSFSFLTDR